MVKQSKTNNKEVLEMRKLHEGGMKICEVAKKFSHLSASSVGDIIRLRTWKNVAEEEVKTEVKDLKKTDYGETFVPEKEVKVKKKKTRSGMTDENALEVRKLHTEGTKVPDLMEKFKVSRLVINCIIHRHTFKHI